MSEFGDPSLAKILGPQITGGADAHENCRVDLSAEISVEAVLEREVVIGKYVNVVGAVHIERAVTVYPFSTLIGPLHIGEGSLIGPGVVIGLNQADTTTRQTCIMEACRVGRAVQILGGLQVGRHARIRAGSLVTGDVPHYGLVAQNPAILEGYACPKCGGLLTQVRLVRGAIDTHCEDCRAGEYRFANQFWADAFNRVLLPYHAFGAPVWPLGISAVWRDEDELGAF